VLNVIGSTTKLKNSMMPNMDAVISNANIAYLSSFINLAIRHIKSVDGSSTIKKGGARPPEDSRC
jgi:hypothetical protein